MLFAGTTEAKLDAKGRVFFPSEFRRQLTEADTQLVLKRDAFQQCLVVYPFSVWQAEVAHLRQRINRWDRREAMFFRQFLADAQMLTLDASGRILIPRRYQEECHIGTTVSFVGADDRVELWDAATMKDAFLSPVEMDSTMEGLAGRLGPEGEMMR